MRQRGGVLGYEELVTCNEFPVVMTACTRPGRAQTRKCLSMETGSSLEVLPLAKKLLARK